MAVILLVAGRETDDLDLALADLCSRVDAVAVMNGAGVLGAAQLASLARRTAVAVIGSSGPGEVITTGSRENARLLTAHLLDHGRKRLVFAGSPELAADADARWRGFGDALRERGLPGSSAR